MKKNTLLLGALALLGLNPLYAEDLTIELSRDNADNITLIELNEDGTVKETGGVRYDIAFGNVGQIGTNTSFIGIGEVDFGADGAAYKAVNVEFAHGWGGYEDQKTLVLATGTDPQNLTPFAELPLFRTGGYADFRDFTFNFSTVLGEYTLPAGAQNVWLYFSAGNGNLMTITFMENGIEEGTDGMQPYLNEQEGYYDNGIYIPAIDFERAVPVIEDDPATEGNDDPYASATYNEDLECWGGTSKGFKVRSINPIDFGNDDYKQIVLYLGRNTENYMDYMKLYLDEVSEENLIDSLWTGMNLSDFNIGFPVAHNISGISGEHTLIIEWTGTNNLFGIDLLKEELWREAPMCGVVFEDIKASADAVKYATIGDSGATAGGDANSGKGLAEGGLEWEIALYGNHDARCEGANIGYTGDGVTLCFYDVDFKNGEYQRIVVEHSCDKNYIGPIEQANFSFYLGDDDIEDRIWGLSDEERKSYTADQVREIFADKEPIAVVRAQGTTNWGNKFGTDGALKEVTGVHNLYIVYNLIYDTSAGANIYGVYLDPQPVSGGEDPDAIENIAADVEGIRAYSTGDAIVVNADEAATVALYTMNGMLVANEQVAAGTTTLNNLNAGLYILRITNAEGQTDVVKALIK